MLPLLVEANVCNIWDIEGGALRGEEELGDDEGREASVEAAGDASSSPPLAFSLPLLLFDLVSSALRGFDLSLSFFFFFLASDSDPDRELFLLLLCFTGKPVVGSNDADLLFFFLGLGAEVARDESSPSAVFLCFFSLFSFLSFLSLCSSAGDGGVGA